MKKVFLLSIISCLFTVGYMNAQKTQVPFFDEKGAVRIQTLELDALADTIAIVYHRADDIVWSRVVYRIIDMREKQNYQLYFPTRPSTEYRSLFRVMLDAITDGLPAYRKDPRDIKPQFEERLEGEDLSMVFAYDEENFNNLLIVDPITNQLTINQDQYMNYVKNQIKFLTQEIFFFDKHTSRLYSKIIAIAPLYSLSPNNFETNQTMQYFQNSVLCWFSFDELRPYLAKQYVIPNGNDTQRLTFDEFFVQKLYDNYLLGESNMYSRMLLDYQRILSEEELEAAIRKEQKRIATELLNFEQDLWEY
jgi:gliding motility associated protien GldN